MEESDLRHKMKTEQDPYGGTGGAGRTIGGRTDG
jgi:hypothetical protein